MNILIVGAGKVGSTLADYLSRENHNVTIIDNDDEAIHRASDTLDVMCIKGPGAAPSVLREGGAGEADLVLATTNMDEVNMLCALTSKRLGAKYTIARVRNFEYTAAQGMLKMSMGIDLLINPENDTAVEISRILRFPSAANIETFYRGRVELMSFRAREEDFFIGQPLSALSRRVRDLPILFCAAERNEEVLIPDGSFVPRVGDKLYLIGAPLGLHGFFELMGRYAPKIRNVFVVGGGRITFYLAALMERMNMKVTVVERKEERCRQLSELLPHTLVINGDGTDQELLESENMAANDAFVALTDRDEDNLIISLYALQKGLKKVVAKCNRQNYTGIVQHLGLDSVISPKLITAGHILQVVRGMQNSKGSVMNALYRIAEGGAEAAEFAVNGTTRHLHTPLKDLRLKRGVLIAVIIHQGQVIIPVGSSVISSGDTVIIISRGMGILDVNDIYDESSMEADV